jgi:starch phosphorylase
MAGTMTREKGAAASRQRDGLKSRSDGPAKSRTQNGRDTICTGTSAEAIAEALIDNLHFLQAKLPQHATRNDWYMALAYTIRDRMLDRYITTVDAMTAVNTAKVVAYALTGGQTSWWTAE